MLAKIACFLGFHVWAYEPQVMVSISRQDTARKCYRCGREENPYPQKVTT